METLRDEEEMYMSLSTLSYPPHLCECHPHEINRLFWHLFLSISNLIMTFLLLWVMVYRFKLYQSFKRSLEIFKELEMIFREPDYIHIQNHLLQNMVQFVKEKQPELLQVYKDNVRFLLTYGPT